VNIEHTMRSGRLEDVVADYGRSAYSGPAEHRAIDVSISDDFQFQPSVQKTPIVLVPTDFTPASSLAFDCAFKIARKEGATVTLIHAVNLNLDPYGPANPAKFRMLLCEEARMKAEPMLVRAKAVGVKATCVVEEGAPAQVITNAARQCGADLIVLAASRHGLLGRLFSQGTVKKVVREAGCPVLVLQSVSKGRKYHD
jgi:nucleotide-binding universal stress UspA family protein